MDAGWRDLEVPLHVGFRGRLAEVTAVGVDEGQVLTLLVGERGARDTRQTIDLYPDSSGPRDSRGDPDEHTLPCRTEPSRAV